MACDLGIQNEIQAVCDDHYSGTIENLPEEKKCIADLPRNLSVQWLWKAYVAVKVMIWFGWLPNTKKASTYIHMFVVQLVLSRTDD